jgi:hypothetical protein
MVMKAFACAAALIGALYGLGWATTAEASPCLTVTLTGTMGGPPNFNGATSK